MDEKITWIELKQLVDRHETPKKLNLRNISTPRTNDVASWCVKQLRVVQKIKDLIVNKSYIEIRLQVRRINI